MDRREQADLARLGRRLGDDPFFLASALKDFAESENLGEAELAERIGIAVEALDRLRLCRCPDPASADFHRDVELIAARFGVSSSGLTQVIRRAVILRVFRDASIGGLQAARDHEPTTDPRPEPE